MPLSPEEDAILRDIDQNVRDNQPADLPDPRQGLPLINETKLINGQGRLRASDVLWKKQRKARLKQERRDKAIVGAVIGFSLLWIGLWVGLLAGAVVLIWRVVI